MFAETVYFRKAHVKICDVGFCNEYRNPVLAQLIFEDAKDYFVQMSREESTARKNYSVWCRNIAIQKDTNTLITNMLLVFHEILLGSQNPLNRFKKPIAGVSSFSNIRARVEFSIM